LKGGVRKSYHQPMAQILTLDPDGRLSLPEGYRLRHHLQGGSRLRVAEDARRIVLEPVEEATPRLSSERTPDAGRRMAAALEKLAASGAVARIEDPVEWQREIRRDRPLPGRG
jgi:bifunctional DNA-binding transcriptional regulator/antitoxin component of YhaV-PrlF toxin-antitoxin module